uniref:cell adhesion molecule 3-like isoform X2 n=1 Tax=Ciona intestinalis TaxID=7719 RepID=UPI000EF4C738|nr:cell adhesion molecule 3-like isoform X2 [Ciona intestinalis]|eukprot:XP_026694603.1 cell adhesion molecule 3-like isoform X2 [Ciona intestinalis]
MQEYSNLGRDSKTLIVLYSATNPKFETKFTDLLINSSSGYLLRSDETLTMNCSADGNPAVTCNWSCSPTNCGSLPNTCEINNVKVVGSTTITCTVGNGVCGGGTTSITQHITVVPKTRIPNLLVDGVSLTATSIIRNITQSLSIICETSNQVQSSTFTWLKDGRLRSSSACLVLYNISSTDAGLYSCNTTNDFGNFSSSLYLNVHTPLVFTTVQTTVPTTGATPPPIPPPDNLGVIIGAAVGGVVAFILIIILVYRLFIEPNKGKQIDKVTSQDINTYPAGYEYAGINLPNEVTYQNLNRADIIDPSSTNYENMRNNVSVKRVEEGYVELKHRDPHGQVVTSGENGGYETAVVRVDKEPEYTSMTSLPAPYDQIQ